MTREQLRIQRAQRVAAQNERKINAALKRFNEAVAKILRPKK